MPTIQITVCANCGKKTCDGGIWKKISIIRKDTGEEDIASCHPTNLIDCQLSYGVSRRKCLSNKKVGDIVTLPDFNNWVNKSIVTVQKIAD